MHDIHTHIGQFWNIFYDFHDVFKALKNNGVTETTFAHLTPKFDDTEKAVEFYKYVVDTLQNAEKFAKEINLKTHALYWAEPLLFGTDYSLEKIFQEFGYDGIALHPTLHNWTKEYPEELTQIFEFAEKHNLPVYIHTGVSEYEEPLQFEPWFRKFPQVKVHLAHCKDPSPIIKLFSKYKNLVGDTAFCPADSYEAICKASFKDRMFFGTDFPITHWYEHSGEENFVADEKNLTESYAKTLECSKQESSSYLHR